MYSFFVFLKQLSLIAISTECTLLKKNFKAYFIPEEKEDNLIWKPSYVAAAKSLQSCPTLCDPIDGSPPGSSVHGIFQARVLE